MPTQRPRPRRGIASVVVGLLVGLLEVASVGPASAEVELVFGLYTSDKPSKMIQQFRPALHVLEERLTALLSERVSIRTHVAKSYDQGLTDLVEGTVDFARFGPASYVLAKRQEPDLSILAIESQKGVKVFYGIICVREDSDIQAVAQLRGRSFAFGDESSTIGRYLSQLYLLNHGIRVNQLASYAYLGRHDLVGTAVGLGRYDAGALKDNTYFDLIEAGIPLREIARFPNVTKPWIARAGMAERIKEALATVLLTLDDPVALGALSKDGFLEGDDSDYDTIREAMDRNNEFFTKFSASSAN